ncbi:proteoglycan 4-like [Anas acuta]|uniref:proteoglycan 4-like n=1 Tax=Anas acuta TaxID=28680 RepID=UPI0035C911F4
MGPPPGVRIPTLGCFDVVSKRVEDGNKSLTVQWPTFRLARNLIVAHNLTADKEYLPGHKELEPLQYPEVAAAASVSWKKVESCIRSTTSLISRTLGKGENIALVLKDVGVLVIEGTRVQIKFYYDFLESLSEQESLQKALFKVPQLMDMVVSRVSAVASLTFSGRVIVFPDFKMDKAPQLSPGERLKARRDDRQEKERAVLSSSSQEKQPELPPFPGTLDIIYQEKVQPWNRKAQQKKEPSLRLPVMPKLPPAITEHLRNQLQKGTVPKTEPRSKSKQEPKTAPKEQVQDQGREKAEKSEKHQESKGQKAAKAPPEVRTVPILEALPVTERVKRPESQKAPGPLETPIVSILSLSSSEGSMIQEPSDDSGRFQRGSSSSHRLPKLQTERFWSVLPDRPKMEASNCKPSTSGTVTHQGASSEHQLPKLVPRPPTAWPIDIRAIPSTCTTGTQTDQEARSSQLEMPKLEPRLPTPCTVRVSASLLKEPSEPSTSGTQKDQGASSAQFQKPKLLPRPSTPLPVGKKASLLKEPSEPSTSQTAADKWASFEIQPRPKLQFGPSPRMPTPSRTSPPKKYKMPKFKPLYVELCPYPIRARPPREPSDTCICGTPTDQGASSEHLQPPKLKPSIPTPLPVAKKASLLKEPIDASATGTEKDQEASSVHPQPPELKPRLSAPLPVASRASLPKEPSEPSASQTASDKWASFEIQPRPKLQFGPSPRMPTPSRTSPPKKYKMPKFKPLSVELCPYPIRARPPREPSDTYICGTPTDQGASSVQLQQPELKPRLSAPLPVASRASLPKESSDASTSQTQTDQGAGSEHLQPPNLQLGSSTPLPIRPSLPKKRKTSHVKALYVERGPYPITARTPKEPTNTSVSGTQTDQGAGSINPQKPKLKPRLSTLRPSPQ